MTYAQARATAEVLKALGHPMRVRIIEELTGGEKCVCELLSLGRINQSNVSRHLAYLKRAGLVSDRREMNRVYYHLVVPEAKRLVELGLGAARKAAAAARKLSG